jgi:hypothetical protein
MASEVDICNLALSHIGDRANISAINPPEGSAQAQHCARFYPMARDEMLQLMRPSFAIKRIALADASLVVTVPSQWQFAYQYPANCLVLDGVFDPNRTYDETDSGARIEVGDDEDDGMRVIYTNVEAAVARYVYQVTDTTRYSPLFTQALSRLLASYLAGPIVKGNAGVQLADAQRKLAMGFLDAANVSDANQVTDRQVREDARHAAPWIRERGLNTQYADGPEYPE